MAPAMAPRSAAIEAPVPTPEPTPEPIAENADPAADRYDEGFADGVAAGEDGMDPETAADVAVGLHDPTRYAEGYAAGVAASARPGGDERADLYQSGFLDGFQEAKGTPTGDEAAAAYARRNGEETEIETDETDETDKTDTTDTTDTTDIETVAEAEVVPAFPPTYESEPNAFESAFDGRDSKSARLTPCESRGHQGALDVVKILGLDPEVLERLAAVDVDSEDDDSEDDDSREKRFAIKSPAARARVAERARARRFAGRVAYRAGVRATRDAVAKKYGAASSAMAALDRAFPEAAREDDDDLLEGGDDPLTEEERDVAGRDGYREGLKTVNDALGTSYSVAEVITRGYGAGEHRPAARATAALGGSIAEDAPEGGALGASALLSNTRMGDSEARRGVMSARRRAVYAGWAAALAAAAAAAAARARRGAPPEGDAREKLVCDAEGPSVRERYGASMV